MSRHRSTKSAKRKPTSRVVIVVDGHVARTARRHSRLVRPIASLVVPVARLGGPLGYRLCHATEQYCALVKKHLILPAGLVPHVAAHLRQRGIRVTVRDETLWLTRNKTNRRVLRDQQLDAPTRELIRAVSANQRGLIVIQEPGGAARVAAAVLVFFGRAHAVVVARSWKSVNALRRQLGKLIDCRLTSNRDELWPMPVRTFLCPAAIFGMSAGHNWDLVVFADVESALAKQCQEIVFRMGAQPCYCCVPVTYHLGPRARLHLEAICGGEIFREPQIPDDRSQVEVLLLTSPLCIGLSRRPDLQQKRELWHNGERNLAVAGLALAVADRDSRYSALRRLLPTMPARGELAVSVLVESTEHGKELLKHLPAWQLKHKIPMADAELPDPVAPATGRTVCTEAFAACHGIMADVIVRADGAEEWPLFPSAFPCSSGKQRSVFILDLVSVNGPNLKRRAAGYEALGWHVSQSRWKVPKASGSRGRNSPRRRG